MTNEERKQRAVQRRKYIEKELTASKYDVDIFGVLMKISIIRWLLC